VTLQDNGPTLIDFSGHTRNIALRGGHFVARSLAVMSTVWQKVLDPSRDKSMEIITDYVVCNSTLESIRFGQVSLSILIYFVLRVKMVHRISQIKNTNGSK
jgi:hypothetical protein